MIIKIFLFISISILLLYSFRLFSNGHLIGIFLGLFSILCAVLVMYPGYSIYLANVLGVGRGADLLIYLMFAIGIIFFIRVVSKIQKLERSNTEIIRLIAIQDVKKRMNAK